MLIDQPFIHTVLPQRPPMIMVDSLLYSDGQTTRCGLKVLADNIFVADGFLQEPGLIENMAQSAAAGTGYKAQQLGLAAPVGFIGAVQNLEVFTLPAVGTGLETVVNVTNQVFDVTFINAVITQNGNLVAQCGMKIFIPKQS